MEEEIMDHRLFDGGCVRVQSMLANGSVRRARSNILIIEYRPRRRLAQAAHAQGLSATLANGTFLS
jgi:hypothetical protein